MNKIGRERKKKIGAELAPKDARHANNNGMRVPLLLGLLHRAAPASFEYETIGLPRCSMAGPAGALPPCTHALRKPGDGGKAMGGGLGRNGHCADWVRPGSLDVAQLAESLARNLSWDDDALPLVQEAMAAARDEDGAHAVAPNRSTAFAPRSTGGSLTPGGSSRDSMEFLRRSLRWLAARQPGQPIRSVETGFALGYSALAVVGAACNAGIHLKHSAMDPYQGAAWRGVGQKRLQSLVGTCASDEVNFELLELPASIGLARMVAGGE